MAGLLDSHKYISTQIEKDIPQFIRMEYPSFVAFIKKYYEWIEQEGKPYHFIANALNYSDVDRTSLEFLDYFSNNLLSKLPNNIYDDNNLRTLIKNVEQYYSASGSEKAFDFLFRLFEYKEDSSRENNIYYPSYDMLRVSDGKWVNNKSVKIIGPVSPSIGDTDYEKYIKEINLAKWKDDIDSLTSGLMVGNTTLTECVVDYAIYYESSSGINIGEIFLLEFDVVHSPTNFINEDFTITKIDESTFTGTIVNNLVNVNMNDSGKYYIPNSKVSITSNALYNEFGAVLMEVGLIGLHDSEVNNDDIMTDEIGTIVGEDAYLRTNICSKGEVQDITIVDGGFDYEVDDEIRFVSSCFGNHAHGLVTEVDGSGTITKVSLISNGTNYDRMPSVEIISTNGYDAILMAESDNIGTIESVKIGNYGINYTTEETTLTFNTIIRLYEVEHIFEIGETITNGAVDGVVEYYDDIGMVMSVRMINGSFSPSDVIIGLRNSGNAIIYDMSLGEGDIVVGSLYEYEGKYINSDGHISSDKYIQDSYFYQMFSYMIKTHTPKSEWINHLDHIHPSGAVALSYEDINTKYEYIIEADGFISPRFDMIEYYKFMWDGDEYDTGSHVDDYNSNTQFKQYADVIFEDIYDLDYGYLNKTDFTFGSEITITE